MKKEHQVSAIRPVLPLWAAFLAAAGAGFLMDLAYPSVGAWPLAFPAIALLLIALIGRRLWMSVLIGLVYGLVFFFLLVSWTSRYLGALPWAALATVEGVLTAVAIIPLGLAYRWVPHAFPSRTARLLLLPAVLGALWAARELFLGSWPYGGFPWARVAMSQSESPLAPVTSWVGVSGLSFLMVFITAMLIESVRLRLWKRPVMAILPVGLLVVLFLVPLYPTTPSGELRIGAVQGNGPTAYFDHREPYEVINAQTAATEELYGEEMDLLVWPEGGLGADPFRDENTARRMTLIANRVGAPLLGNVATKQGELYYNTTMLWMPDGTAEQQHAKRHPVPFGEYVPNREFFNALVPELIGLLQREYTPGTNPPLVTVRDIPLGLAICFDVIYDDVLWEGIEGGAQALIYQTNNADFRDTDENVQQLAFARMRAIEAGRTVVNISTVGTSQIIGFDGSTVASLNADEAGAMLEDVELRTGLTAGIVLGPWIQQFLLWGGIIMLIVSRFRRRSAAA